MPTNTPIPATPQPSPSQDSPNPTSAPIRIDSITVKNFRGIDHLKVEFEEKLTVLVGRNNSGKSRILRAVALALGTVHPDRDDITVSDAPDGGHDETPSAEAKNAYIDIVIAPMAEPGGEDRFSRALNPLIGTAVQMISESPISQRIAWRTHIRASEEGLSGTATRTLLNWDNNAKPEREEPCGNNHTGAWVGTTRTLESGFRRSLCRAHLVESGRDLVAEIRQRGTAANRLVDKLDIDPSAVEDLQCRLESLGKDLVTNSATFAQIQDALGQLARRIDAVGEPLIRPVPARLDDLSSVASIELVAHSGVALPLRLHGTGARSVASLRLQGVSYDLRLGADGGDLRPFPVSLIEEPEAHLHPQAQMDLARMFEDIPGQVIISTHSTHLVSEVEPRSLRVLRPTKSGFSVRTLQPIEDPGSAEANGVTLARERQPRLYVSEMEKLRRLTERPFGEILFASAIIIGDGATERALLPPLLRKALKSYAHGICVIDPGSMEKAKPIVKAAKLLGIPWFLFADGDAAGDKAVNDLVPKENERPTRVVQITDGRAIEQMILDHDRMICIDAISEFAPEPLILDENQNVPDKTIIGTLKKHKGVSGRFLAHSLIDLYPDHKTWPEPIVQLIDLVNSQITSSKTNNDEDSPA